MTEAVVRCRIRVGASLKSTADRHGLPAIRPFTATSSGQGLAPRFPATVEDVSELGGPALPRGRRSKRPGRAVVSGGLS